MTTARKTKPQELPTLLQHHWLERKRQSSDFSLRKFAQLLNIDATALSRIMKGERQPTPETLDRICERLMINPEDIAPLGSALIGKRGRPSKKREIADTLSSQKSNYQQLSQDTFEAMSNWYYFAILELALVDDFQPQPKWIAQRLGISEMEVKIALQTLQRLNLITLNSDGSWSEENTQMTNIQPNITNPARRKLQKQLLEKSIAALETVSIEKRDHTSLTFAVDSSTLEKAKERIKEFRRDMNRLMQKSTTRDEVYQLTISLFPATNH